jgi:hypothetical protein
VPASGPLVTRRRAPASDLSVAASRTIPLTVNPAGTDEGAVELVDGALPPHAVIEIATVATMCTSAHALC